MKKRLLILFFIFTTSGSYGYNDVLYYSDADRNKALTRALHAEVFAHTNPNITRETHPVLYDLVESLAAIAKKPMPRYITIFKAEYSVISENQVVERAVHTIEARIDLLGDLHICYELLTDLDYNEIEGVIALAIAEKIVNKPAKIAATGITTFIATVGLIYHLNKAYDLRLGHIGTGEGFTSSRRAENAARMLLSASIAPALLTSSIAANNLQRSIDAKAAQLTNPQTVIDAIRAMARVTETYDKENIFSRVATALHLKPIYRFLFYPVRSFTDDERIAYLQAKSYC